MTTRGVRWGGRNFRPNIFSTIAVVAFVALTVSLGNWQGRRAEEKIEAARALEEAARGPVLAVPPVPVDAAGFQHRRVSASGRYLAGATFFLDNKVLRGVAGYHVLTPLRIEGGDMHVLIDRGWIAAGDRARLPEVPTPEAGQTVEGIATLPSRRFVELAPEAPNGSLRQNLVIEREAGRLALKLQPFVIEQTSEAPDGLARVWERAGAGAERNIGYELQWYSFAALAVILYVVLNFKRAQAG
jgi:surfeit locus 1 family protein